MSYFFSCDWGTSSFRLRLVNPDDFNVITESTSAEGIGAIYTLWQEMNDPDQDKRVSFYLEVIKKHIKEIEKQTSLSLAGTPLIISGMASSTIGFIDLPYKPIPVAIDGTDIITASIPARDDFDYPAFVISGLRTNSDVIRGEETQLIGCIDLIGRTIKDELFIFPGTHSKHIRVKDNQVIDFKTYMTGEFFELLSKKSILRIGVETPEDAERPELSKYFKKGVNDAIHANLLNIAFKTRTNHLFNTLSKKENFSYLNGLVIGTELKDLMTIYVEKINLLAGSNLHTYYSMALKELSLSGKLNTFSANLDESVVRGQYKIYRQSLI
jgi:2-dehydro-3-deoxygalactonokinase